MGAESLTKEETGFLISVLNRYTEGPVADESNLEYFTSEHIVSLLEKVKEKLSDKAKILSENIKNKLDN